MLKFILKDHPIFLLNFKSHNIQLIVVCWFEVLNLLKPRIKRNRNISIIEEYCEDSKYSGVLSQKPRMFK